MTETERLKRRLEKISRLQESLRREMERIEKKLSGGDDWGGTFKELFGTDGPVRWHGLLIVPRKTYKRIYQAQLIQGSAWASTFGGPAYCRLEDREIPVVMKGAREIFRKSLGYDDYKKILLKLAKKHDVSITCVEDAMQAKSWAEAQDAKRKTKTSYLDVIRFEIVSEIYSNSPKLKSLFIKGKIISPDSIMENMIKKGANAKYIKAMRIAERFNNAARIQNRRKRNGRHSWASSLKKRAEKIYSFAYQVNERQSIFDEAKRIFEQIVVAGKIDKKIRSLI